MRTKSSEGIPVAGRGEGLTLLSEMGLKRLTGAAVWATIAFGFYLATAARDLSWANSGADGGDLITAAWVGGVPHPSGYPLWLLLAGGLLHLPLGTPAWRATLISVAGGAVAVGFTARAAARLLPRTDPPGWRPMVVGVTALALMTSPLLWGQSVIAEVYALQAGLMALALEGLLAWSEDGEAAGVRRAALGWGLALANHLTALWLAPAALWLLLRRRPGRRLVGQSLALVLVGPLLYLTLPLRAVALPPINWGGADRLGGLLWLVSGRIYRSMVFGLPARDFIPRISAWLSLTAQQVGPPGLVLVLWGATLLVQRRSQLAGPLALFLVFNTVYAISYNTSDSFTYLIPNNLVLVLLLAVGLAALPGELPHRWQAGPPLALLALVLLALIPLLTVLRFGRETAQSGPQGAARYVNESVAALEPGAVVFAQTDEHIFAMWYAAYVVAPRRHITVVVDGLLPYEWYRRSLAENHPTLRWPEGDPANTRAILEANLDDAPIYLTEATDRLGHGFEMTPAGPLFRVRRR
ncbi:MAG: DUF2723 domain-containing protein [Ardenticatenaceae bacterium]|nr:DUF2723 domain-containing protein [Ardenticatenaceae bacterium]